MVVDGLRNAAEGADRGALQYMEEAVEVATQWAQEKLDTFLREVESNGNDHKLLKISYIISRRTTVDVFTGQRSEIGDFASTLIKGISEGKIMETLGNMAGTLLNKLFGAASGSAQTERVYEVTFDELGGLNCLDALFFSYRFASSGMTEFSKAVIGVSIVRSAANMVDDNAYRVVLTSAATLENAQRSSIAQQLIEVAKTQNQALDEDGKMRAAEPGLLQARAQLAQVIGEGVASSYQFEQRKKAGQEKATEERGKDGVFQADGKGKTAQEQAKLLEQATSTVVSGQDKPAQEQAKVIQPATSAVVSGQGTSAEGQIEGAAKEPSTIIGGSTEEQGLPAEGQ